MKNITKEKWNENLYQTYRNELRKLADLKYREFHKKLTTTKYEILGISVPKLRQIAKQINKTDTMSFFSFCQNDFYEEVLIEGLVIASLEDENDFLTQLEKYLPKIDNWAICDSFCNSFKIVAKNPKNYFDYFCGLLKRTDPFTIRVGLVTILNFYINQECLETIFQHVNEITTNHYYVNMATSWLLAEMYIYYPIETENYLKKAKINDFTMNKTISKIRDSYRVSKEKKEELLKYKRKDKK